MNKEENKNTTLTFENLVDYAIVDGYQRGINLFMEELDHTLQVNTVIEEAGSIDNLVGAMLEEQENPETDFDEVSAKLDKLMVQ
jgi:hypothetical protein